MSIVVVFADLLDLISLCTSFINVPTDRTTYGTTHDIIVVSYETVARLTETPEHDNDKAHVDRSPCIVQATNKMLWHAAYVLSLTWYVSSFHLGFQGYVFRPRLHGASRC